MSFRYNSRALTSAE